MADPKRRTRAAATRPDRIKRQYGSSDPSRRRLKLSETIAAQILDNITEAGLVEGDQLLPEAAMLQTYEGGRASLREALRILETNGLITIKAGPKGGAVVGSVDPVQFGRMSTRYFQMAGATIGDLIEARLILEPKTTALAASKRDPENIARLEEWLARSGEPGTQTDDAEYMSDAHEFHSLIIGMSGNLILDLITLAIKDVFNARVKSAIYPPSARKRVRSTHQEIARLTIAGKAEEAEQLMRTHLEEFAAYAARRLPGLLDDTVSWQ